MAATRKAKSEDAQEGASITVSTRLTPDELRKLDEIAENTAFNPSRSQLIAHAVREFLKESDAGKRKG